MAQAQRLIQPELPIAAGFSHHGNTAHNGCLQLAVAGTRHPSLNAGRLDGSSNTNLVPGTVEIRLDRRVIARTLAELLAWDGVNAWAGLACGSLCACFLQTRFQAPLGLNDPIPRRTPR